MIDGGEPRLPQKGEVKRRGEPPIGGRVKRPPRARVRASSGFRQSLPAAGLGGRSIGRSPNAAGLTGFHRRRGLCGESSLKAKETEPCGGSGSSHGTRVEGPAGGAGPSRFRDSASAPGEAERDPDRDRDREAEADPRRPLTQFRRAGELDYRQAADGRTEGGRD